MRYLHIMQDVDISRSYINFVNDNFNKNEHLCIFTTITQLREVSIKDDINVHYLKKVGVFRLINSFYKFKKIYLHSIFDSRIVLLMFFQPWLLKKCYWVVWGGDLYHYRKAKVTIKSKIYELIRKFVIRNMGNVCTLVKGDYNFAKEWYNVKGRYLEAIYLSGKDNMQIETIVNQPNYFKQERNKIRILVGNSASDTNNHLEAFDLIEKFKDENIEIICPLSYGDMEYARKVKEYGSNIFGDKFISLDDFMNIKEYMDYLSKIDIGIFNNNRQQALGNIFSLIELGKKVYMRSDTTMWEEIKNHIGMEIFDIKDIESISINELIKLEENTIYENIKKLKYFHSPERIKEIWIKIFTS